MLESRDRPQPRALFILGMHRSGTSSLGGLVKRLGVPLGTDLMQPDPSNPRGYAENLEVLAIHDRFLGACGVSWSTPRAPQPAQFEGEAACEAHEKIAKLVRREFGQEPLFAVKDPRLCRLLPLWRPVLEEQGIEAVHVLMLRHPLEVATSLEQRDGLGRALTLPLWTGHLLAAERETRGQPRCLVEYAELLEDWRGVAGRLASQLGVAWPRAAETAAPEIESFLSADLRHYRISAWPAAEAARFPWAVRIWQELLALRRDGESAERRMALDALGAGGTTPP